MTDTLGRLIADLDRRGGFVRYIDGRAGLPPARDGARWLIETDFQHPRQGHLADMIAHFEAGGFVGKRRITAAALMLRLGWAGGMQIGSWLLHDQIIVGGRYALQFSSGQLLVGVAVCGGEPIAGERGGGNRDHAAMAQSLHGFAAPIAASLHRWSRLSERALMAMIASSWAAQFTGLGHAIAGGERAAVEAARCVFAAHPDLARAAPALYRVEAGGRYGWCQKRPLCCLYFKGPQRVFCDSCPILPEAERLARNRALVHTHGHCLPQAPDPQAPDPQASV